MYFVYTQMFCIAKYYALFLYIGRAKKGSRAKHLTISINKLFYKLFSEKVTKKNLDFVIFKNKKKVLVATKIEGP